MRQRDVFAQIWKMSNEVRGQIEGWDFRHYVLILLFYRFISEDFARFFETTGGAPNYDALFDDAIPPEFKDAAIRHKGYFIYPSQLFINAIKKARGQ